MCRYPQGPLVHKRLLEIGDDADEETRTTLNAKKRKTVKTKKVARKPVATKPTRGLLDLPGEIRNRIYAFVTDDDGDGDKFEDGYRPYGYTEALRPLFSPGNLSRQARSKKRFAKPSYKYYGLTQVCRQIRAEFFPLWRREASFRINLDQFDKFVETFCPETNEEEYKNSTDHNVGAAGPKLLQLSCDHAEAKDDTLQLLPFFQFRFRYPNTRIELLWGGLTENSLPEWLGVMCKYCGFRGRLFTRPICECQSIRLMHWEGEFRRDYQYLARANAVLNSNNERLLADIRRGFIGQLDITRNVLELFFSRRCSRRWPSLQMFLAHEDCEPQTCEVWRPYFEEIGIELSPRHDIYSTWQPKTLVLM